MRRHPEIDEEPIAAPVFGLGLPRTGSTALSFLLAQDPDIRYLRAGRLPSPVHRRRPCRATTRVFLLASSGCGRNWSFPALQQAGVRYTWDGEQSIGMLERSIPTDQLISD
jgi:hypothetical protein